NRRVRAGMGLWEARRTSTGGTGARKGKIAFYSSPCARTVSLVQHLPGSSVLSAFRRERLLAQLKQAGLPVADVSARYEHFISVDAELDADAARRLAELLDYGTPAATTPPPKGALELMVIPRLGTVSPWASKATDIVHNCGLAAVRRVERGVRYTLVPERGLLGAKSLDG